MTAVDAAARQLTLRHRDAQLAVARSVAVHVLEQWGLVDPVRIDATWPRIAAALREVVDAGHAASVQTAAGYLRLHAALYGVDVADLALPDSNPQQVDTSLRVTGPVALKRATGDGQSLDAASANAATMLVGAATRLSLAGGRTLLHDTIESDDSIIGWRRVGDGHSCNFCEALISRGAVYKSADTAGRGNSYHDHDGCVPEPAYVGQDEPPEVLAAYERYLSRRHAGSTF